MLLALLAAIAVMLAAEVDKLERHRLRRNDERGKRRVPPADD